MKNCVNYGVVTHDGKTSWGNIYIGGIAGEIQGSNAKHARIQDCTNYGDIKIQGRFKETKIQVRGTFGNTISCDLKNCTNYGKITKIITTPRSRLNVAAITVGVIIIIIAAIILIIVFLSLIYCTNRRKTTSLINTPKSKPNVAAIVVGVVAVIIIVATLLFIVFILII